MKNIHLIQTDKPSKLYLTDNNILTIIEESNYGFSHINYVNIYITSDEKIEEERLRWIIDNRQKMNGLIHEVSVILDSKICPEIILTTDEDLIKNGVQSIDNEFLQWFVKNPSCEFVETKIVHDYEEHKELVGNPKEYWSYYETIIPEEEPKK